MESAVRSLEIEFKKVNNDLNYSMHRLEADFSKIESEYGAPDVISLVRRMKHLQKEIEEMEIRAACLRKTREKVFPELIQQLMSNFSYLQTLCCRTKLESDDNWFDAAKGVQHLAADLGVTLNSETAQTATDAINEAEDNEAEEDNREEFSQSTRNKAKPISTEISEDEFLSIPARVRGRSKLELVNQVFNHIVSSYIHQAKASGRVCKPRPVSLKDLDAAGLKVSGLTGRQILDTLRALDRVTLEKQSIILKQSSQYLQGMSFPSKSNSSKNTQRRSSRK